MDPLFWIPPFLEFAKLGLLAGLTVLLLYALWLLVKALKKYLAASEVRREKAAVCRSLGEALKAHRLEKKMTQEFVAERLGVSRQAVSKWESGTSDPSTANLLALARLYGVDAETLLREATE